LPAAGKTSLSRFLAEHLGFAHIRRDGLRRSFHSIASVLGEDQGHLIGRALDEVINDVARSVVAAGQGAVIDSNFNIPEQAEAVRALVSELKCPCFEICLWADAEVLRRRFIARGDPPMTDALRPYFEMVLARIRTPVLGPPVPTVELDTTDFAYLEAVKHDLIGDIRNALGAPVLALHRQR